MPRSAATPRVGGGTGPCAASPCRQLSLALPWQPWAGGQTRHRCGIPVGVAVLWSSAASPNLRRGQMLDFLPSWRRDGGDGGWPRSVLLSEVVPCALTAFPALRCGSPCHLPGPRAGPQAGSPAQGRLLPPPPWAAEPPGSLQASWPVYAQGQGSEAGSYTSHFCGPVFPQAPATLLCRARPHPVQVPPVTAFASSIPGLPQPLSCPSQTALGQPPPLLPCRATAPALLLSAAGTSPAVPRRDANPLLEDGSG